jgi:D-tyrosyl-tRNA(Tyr) deacylase
MRAVVQRVSGAAVKVDGRVVGQIGQGLLVLLGVGRDDTIADADYLVDKTLGLRIFRDEQGKMNLDLFQSGGSLLVVSQFTLYGDCRKGRRPSFDQAAEPGRARALYEYFVERARARQMHVETGEFQASMSVELVNDGPVTLLFDSKRLF